MATIKMKMTTNARLVGDVLPNKRSTFYALKELINNSIKAGATIICIDLLSSDCDENSLLYRPIEKIVISDNGEGVSESRFANRIMEIATESEDGGNGTGRFAGLLIGRTMTIETTAYDQQLKKKTISSVTFHAENFSKGNINDVEFPVTYTDTESETPSGYKVTLSNLYNNDPDCARKNKLSAEFKSENFAVEIVNLHKELTKKKKEFQIADQIKRSGSAIGALVCEAIYAESSADFVHKLKIALKECHETAYWLRVLHRTEYMNDEEFKRLTDQNEELKRMLISSVKTKLKIE